MIPMSESYRIFAISLIYKARFVMIFNTAGNSLRHTITLTEAYTLLPCDLRAYIYTKYVNDVCLVFTTNSDYYPWHKPSLP